MVPRVAHSATGYIAVVQLRLATIGEWVLAEGKSLRFRLQYHMFRAGAKRKCNKTRLFARLRWRAEVLKTHTCF